MTRAEELARVLTSLGLAASEITGALSALQALGEDAGRLHSVLRDLAEEFASIEVRARGIEVHS